MLITCHCENRLGYVKTIRAYDPDIDAWFNLEGLDSFVHVGDDYLRFSVIENKQKHKTGLPVDVLWRCWVPRFKNIEQTLAR